MFAENEFYRTVFSPEELLFLPHAALRMRQRNLTIEDVETVFRYGHAFHRAGRKIYFLAKCDIPIGWEKEMSRLSGVTVVLTEGKVLTVYRSRKAIRKIKRQSKFKYRPRFSNNG